LLQKRESLLALCIFLSPVCFVPFFTPRFWQDNLSLSDARQSGGQKRQAKGKEQPRSQRKGQINQATGCCSALFPLARSLLIATDWLQKWLHTSPLCVIYSPALVEKFGDSSTRPTGSPIARFIGSPAKKQSQKLILHNPVFSFGFLAS